MRAQQALQQLEFLKKGQLSLNRRCKINIDPTFENFQRMRSRRCAAGAADVAAARPFRKSARHYIFSTK